jgi:hypothetical protein
MDKDLDNATPAEIEHAKMRIAFEEAIRNAVTTVFADLEQRGVWKGDPKRVAGTVSKYATSILERGLVRLAAAAAA